MEKKKVLVIDGQGGRLGGELVKKLIPMENIEVIAIGTNTLATQAMLKSGAEFVATGENPVIFNSKKVDVIVGPIGIVISNALLGEITPKMALAVGESSAKKVLIPINKCDNFIIASEIGEFKELVEKAVLKIKEEI